MAKAIMVQGTMSNAGKSILAAGLCRVFRQDGCRVAPFKAQNMALNSFITREGLEMGRAQVVQAEAAGVEPSVLMNPILLKPTNDTGSQVIVNGEVWGQMTAREYFAVKKQLVPDVMRAYQQLSDENDVIVIEGAGSPAEINLKNDDCFVNMGMAKAAKAPVLLVGDIDRGGVFAQLWGTVGLLDPDERAMVKGLVINKFRGDESILMPGVRQLEELTGIPVVGVVTAGLPVLAVENIEGYLPWDGETGCFALRVRGDSMIGAGILNGDKVVVRPQSTAENGEIVVALLDDSATVKRFKRSDRGVWLMPENPNFQPIDGREAKIIGRVKAVIRNY